MTTARAWVASLSLACLAAAGACASAGSDDESGAGGAGQGVAGQGVAGSTGQGGAGSSGTAGSPGQGGAGQGVAGSTGQGVAGQGVAGAAGSPGQGGASGPAGAGGSPGRGGTTGLAGAGPAGSTGQAGSAPGGSGGSSVGTLPKAVTSSNGTWNANVAVTVVTSGTADVTVNDTSVKQNWEGFGGAFNEMGWGALQKLSEADRAKALQLLFGVDGAHFAFGRIPMGASDYACDDISKYPNCDKTRSRYTLDDTAGDTALNNFSIARDMKALIPYIKAAQGVRQDIHFWSSPWTPPPWMKSNNGFDGGNMKDDDAILKAYAQYFVKFVDAYGQQGITIEAVAPQNEPNFSQTYPSAIWATALYTKFVGQYLGPAFASANVKAHIMLGTMSNSDPDAGIVSNLLGNATAKGYVKSVGMQWGMVDKIGGLKGSIGSLPIWQTEHKCGNYPWLGGYQSTAPNDQAYGKESWDLIKQWINAGVTQYSAWNMVLDTVGKGIDTSRDWAQNALLTVNVSSKTLIQTPTFQVFRHCSQFLQPGAKVVGTSGGDALAFKNPDGTIIAVMYNSGGAKNAIVQIAGKKLQFSIPGSGWATVVSQ
jgi:glucosylceramidase